jgi:hypothetical protein
MEPLIIADATTVALSIIRKILPDTITIGLLFEGSITDKNKTKLAVDKLIARYEASIKGVNRAIAVNVLFVLLALYPFVASLKTGDNIKLPILDVSISVGTWFRLCPLISFGIQIYLAAMLMWFLLLRRGLDLLMEKMPAAESTADHVGEVSDLLLDGFIGVMWLLAKVREYFRFRINYLWFLPVMILLGLVVVSPSALCAFFLYRLYAAGDLLVAVIYSILMIPSIFLTLALLSIGGLLSLGRSRIVEPAGPLSRDEASYGA